MFATFDATMVKTTIGGVEPAKVYERNNKHQQYDTRDETCDYDFPVFGRGRSQTGSFHKVVLGEG